MTTRTEPSEAEIQRMIVIMLRMLGWTVYSLSQGYRKEKGGTRQTPGLPDLFAFHRVRQVTLWVEVKPPREQRRLAKLLARSDVPRSAVRDVKRARAQQVFRELCAATGQPYAYGDVGDVMGVLRALGFRVGAA